MWIIIDFSPKWLMPVSLFLCTWHICSLATKSRCTGSLWEGCYLFSSGNQVRMEHWSLNLLQLSAAAGPRHATISQMLGRACGIEKSLSWFIYNDILCMQQETPSLCFTWEWNLPFGEEFPVSLSHLLFSLIFNSWLSHFISGKTVECSDYEP